MFFPVVCRIMLLSVSEQSYLPKKADLDVMQSQPLRRTQSANTNHVYTMHVFFLIDSDHKLPRANKRRPFIRLFFLNFSTSSQARKEMLKHCACMCTFVAFVHSLLYIFFFPLGA